MIGVTEHPKMQSPRVSYSQNGEDILLDRVFGDEVGRYMDVGSYHPFIGNNTFFFYERGWRGISIEPTQQGYALLQAHRPEDLNLNLAVSDQDGEMTLYEVLGDRGNSTLQGEIAEPYRTDGVEMRAHPVPVRSLRSLIQTYGIEPPDLVSIDVEGHEAAVIRGMPLDTWRPRVLVIEATLPLTTTPSHELWEPSVLAHGYLFAAFNGVNRFYLREDLRDRLDRLATPINVFDHYVTHELLVHHQRARELEHQVAVEVERQAELKRSWEMERQAMVDVQAAMAAEQAAMAAEQAAMAAEQAAMAAAHAALAHEHAELMKRLAELEQQNAQHRHVIEVTQRALRPYRLLDRLGLVTKGYGWARKFNRGHAS
jgi:FkbM family methyltransferase